METLPKPANRESEARPVSEILASANPAEMPAMRASLSFLTSAGAELANALARRNREYDELFAIVSALPPEWVEAAKTGTSLPDASSLRAELELAKDERIDLRGQLAERQQQIQNLQEQIDQLQAELAAADQAQPAAQAEDGQFDARVEELLAEPEAPLAEAEAAQLAIRVEELLAELDSTALARSQAEDTLRSSQAELADIEQQLADLRDDLWGALPEDIQATLPATPTDEQLQDPRQRRAMRLGALAAAASAMIERSRQSDGLVEEAQGKIGSLEEALQGAEAQRVALEADLSEQVQTLADLQAQVEQLEEQGESLNAQIEQLSSQNAALQEELEAAQAAKVQLEEQLLATEGELAELNQQIDSVGQELRSVLPDDVVAQLMPPETPEAEEVTEGEAAEAEMATRSAAPKMLGLGALAAGVSAAVGMSQQKAQEADEANSQLASSLEEKTSLENSLQEKEQTLASLNEQLESMNAQIADLQGQLDATLAQRTDLEQQLSQRNEQLDALQSQVDEATTRLQAIIPTEDLPEAEPEAEASEEGAGLATRAAGLGALVFGVSRMSERNASSVAELDSQQQALQAELSGLQQEKTDLEAALAARVQELAEYNDYALNLQGQVNQIAAEKSAVEADLQVRTQSQTEAEAQFDSLTAQVNDLQAQVAVLQGQIGDLNSELEARNAAKAEVEQALQETQAQLESAQNDLAQIEQESQQALGSRAVGLGAVGAGVATVAALRDKEAELAAANEQVLALQGQINEMAAGSPEVAILQGQVQELTSARAEIEAQLEQRGVEIENLASQLSALEAERNDIALSKETLLADLQGRENELAELQSQLEALQQQIVSVGDERDTLQVRLASMEQSMDELETKRSAIEPLAMAAELQDALAQMPAFKTRAAAAAMVAGAQPVFSSKVQALNDVWGIGWAYQQRLYNSGVGTYWELANLPNDFLQETLQVPPLQRKRVNLDETRRDAYRWAQETQTVGQLWDGDHVDDFEQLVGIGKIYEKRLYEAGITTYEQLAACTAEQLAEIIQAPEMQDVSYDSWIEQGQQMLASRQTDEANAHEEPAGEAAEPDDETGSQQAEG